MKGLRSILLFLVVGAIFLAADVWWLGSAKAPPSTSNHQPSTSTTPSSPSTSTSNLQPPHTSRGTRVYAVVDASNKVHRAITEDADVRIVGLVGRGEAIVEANEAGRARLAANPRLTVGDAPMKTLPDVPLRAGELTVVPLRTEDLALIERTVASNGGEVLGRCGTLSKPNLRIRGTEETIAALMDLAEARWIENYERPHFFNYNSARTMHVNECWPSSAGNDCGATGLGLTGKGQLLTTADTGIDTGDVKTMIADLKPNVVGCATVYPGYSANDDPHGHGTHTAGSMVGTGAMSGGTYKGMAYEAKLWAWMCYANDGDGLYSVSPIDYAFRPVHQPSYANCGMVSYIYSASYGSDGSSYWSKYESESSSMDLYCWEHPDFLPCWAAANNGADQSLSCEATAKNVLVVGASNGSGIAYFSSRGPTKDGRIKPDICAPGMNIASCNSTRCPNSGLGNYQAMSGTSMATPLTAGTCALLRQWLVEKRGLKKPSSALMKAILMGGATKLKSVAKTAQGEGRINLRASIAPEDGLGVFVVDWIPVAEGDTVTYYIQTTEPAPFDAELVWVDYPGTVTSDQSASKLVNDLDLRVEALGGFVETALPSKTQVWLGNGGETPDRLNNVENIRDTSFPKGRYKLVIEGSHVPHSYGGANSSGAVALYVRGAFDPRGVRTRDKLPPAVYFR